MVKTPNGLPRGPVDYIERQILDELFEWVLIENRRVLVVGAPLGGWLPVELAKRTMFTTIIHPDDNRIADTIVLARENRVDKRMNFFSRNYMDVQFEASGFDSMVLYEVVSDFPDMVEMLKKCRRELRAGGKFFLIQSVRFGLEELADYMGTRGSRALEKIEGWVSSIQRRFDLASLVGKKRVAHAALMKTLDRFIQLDHVELRHIVSRHLSGVQTYTPEPLRRLLDPFLHQVDTFERELVKEIPWKFLASSLLVKGSKQLEIGKVFKIRSTRPDAGYY